MRERPILFNDAMVRAILSGQKTQTRRVMKPQPSFFGAMGDPAAPFKTLDAGLHARMHCPFGEAGDRLWVREAHSIRVRPESATDGKGRAWYRADSPFSGDDRVKWKPSIHMPRWACRILLEITSVRVERLNDIGQGAACAEGCPAFHEPIGWFSDLWESINGAGSWDANPWVWVVEFRRIAA